MESIKKTHLTDSQLLDISERQLRTRGFKTENIYHIEEQVFMYKYVVLFY